jgi:hypothetical protein
VLLDVARDVAAAEAEQFAADTDRREIPALDESVDGLAGHAEDPGDVTASKELLKLAFFLNHGSLLLLPGPVTDALRA